MNSRLRLAVLIDAENVSYKRDQAIFSRIESIGDPVIRRAYGDWTSTALQGWLAVAEVRGISLKTQRPCAHHKNGSDIALAVDAMDLLHVTRPDGFVIVSGDSDFTPLVTRLRESLRPVYALGGANTSKMFRDACTAFFELDVDQCVGRAAAAMTIPVRPSVSIAASASAEKSSVPKAVAKKVPAKELGQGTKQLITPNVEARLRTAIDKSAGADGWASLSVFGKQVGQDIRPKNFGHATWIKLFTGRKGFQIRKKPHAAVRSTA